MNALPGWAVVRAGSRGHFARSVTVDPVCDQHRSAHKRHFNPQWTELDIEQQRLKKFVKRAASRWALLNETAFQIILALEATKHGRYVSTTR